MLNKFVSATETDYLKDSLVVCGTDLYKCNSEIVSAVNPELKANTNFMNLQENLKEIENNISYARQIYNKAVLKYKNKLEMFPSNIIADIFNFKPELFFTIDSDDRENPNINFNEK